jgi:hypothetical protein
VATIEDERRTVEAPSADELEELWAAPAREPDVSHRPLPGLNRILAWGWGVFVVSIFFEPAPAPNAVYPVWGYVLSAAFFAALLVAGLFAVRGATRLSLGAASAAGLAGLALAIGCRATAHHAGAWWLYELGASAALLALGAIALARSPRRGL